MIPTQAELEKQADELLAGTTKEEWGVLMRLVRGNIARNNDNAEGFSNFFFVVFGLELPEHARSWVESIYAAKAINKGRVIEAFRGSAKTTILTIGFTLFRMGHDPHKANLLVQVADDIADINTGQMADIIEHNPGWKICFPHIEPDKQLGWSSKGFEIKDTSYEYGAWREKNARRKDPSLIGMGYRSNELIGKRPDGVLIVDDINDLNNTESPRESETVLKVVTSTIFPMKTPDTWMVFVGTPWTTRDVLSYVKATGDFVCTKTPAIDKEGKSVWADRFTAEELESRRRLSGSVEFARMYALDLDAAAGSTLKREWLHKYPASQIGASWAVYFGVDYASTIDKLKGGVRDYCTIAIGRAIPGGGIVVIDGFRGIVSQGEAQQKLIAMNDMYGPALIGVESVGKGEEFYGLLLRTTNLPIMEGKTGRASKGARFEKQLAPLFEFSRAWVSDAPTPFLQEFEKEWLLFPNADHDDTLDAVYWMCSVAQGHLMLPGTVEEFQKPVRKSLSMYNFGRL